jgi:cyanophycin synthetase
VEAVSINGMAVLNADDPLVLTMADVAKGSIMFFAKRADNAAIAEHRAQGRRAVFVREKMIILAEGTKEQELMSLQEICFTEGGRILFQVENVLAAVGAVWALGIERRYIEVGLRTFCSNDDDNPGRYGVTTIGGATVILDYAHNWNALHSIVQSLPRHHPRKLAVYSVPGDRRNVDIIEQGRLLGNSFDAVWVYDGEYRRGRQVGEIPDLLRQGIESASRHSAITVAEQHFAAIDEAMRETRPNDLLFIQADTIDETLAYFRRKYSYQPALANNSS